MTYKEQSREFFHVGDKVSLEWLTVVVVNLTYK